MHSPALQPAEMAQPIRRIALDTEADIPERDEETRNGSVESEVDDCLSGGRKLPRGPVDAESTAQNGKVERWVVVVDVGDTSHDCGEKLVCDFVFDRRVGRERTQERQVVQPPPNDRVDTSVVEEIQLALCHVAVSALPADEVERHHAYEDKQRGCAAPVYDRVTEQEVLDDVVVPAAHTQTDVQQWPLPRCGGQIVLFVWVGHERIVAG